MRRRRTPPADDYLPLFDSLPVPPVPAAAPGSPSGGSALHPEAAVSPAAPGADPSDPATPGNAPPLTVDPADAVPPSPVDAPGVPVDAERDPSPGPMAAPLPSVLPEPSVDAPALSPDLSRPVTPIPPSVPAVRGGSPRGRRGRATGRLPALRPRLPGLLRAWLTEAETGAAGRVPGRRVVALAGDWSAWAARLPEIEALADVEWHVFSTDAAAASRYFPSGNLRIHDRPYGHVLFPEGFFDAVWLLPAASEIPLVPGDAFGSEGPDMRRMGKAFHDVRPGGWVVAVLDSKTDRALLRGSSLAARCLRVWGEDWQRLPGSGEGLWAGRRAAVSLDIRQGLRAVELPSVAEFLGDGSPFRLGAGASPATGATAGGTVPGEASPEHGGGDSPAGLSPDAISTDHPLAAETGQVYARAQEYLALRTSGAYREMVRALHELSGALRGTPSSSAVTGTGPGDGGLSPADARTVRRHLQVAPGGAVRSFLLRLLRTWEKDPGFVLCHGGGETEDESGHLPWQAWLRELDRNGCAIDIDQLADRMGVAVTDAHREEWLASLREAGWVFRDPVHQDYVGPRTLVLTRGAELWRWFEHRPEWQTVYAPEWTLLRRTLEPGESAEVELALGSSLLPVEVVTGYLESVARESGVAFHPSWVRYTGLPGQGRHVALASGKGIQPFAGLFGFRVTVEGRRLEISGRVVLRALISGQTPLLYERLERQYTGADASVPRSAGLADAFAALDRHLAQFHEGFRQWFWEGEGHAARRSWLESWRDTTTGFRVMAPLEAGPAVMDRASGVPTSSPPGFPGWQSAAREKALQQGRLFVARSPDEGRVEFFVNLFRELHERRQVERLVYVVPDGLLPVYRSALAEALTPVSVPSSPAGDTSSGGTASRPLPMVVAGHSREVPAALFRMYFGDAAILLLSYEAWARLYPGVLPEDTGIGEWYYQRLAWSARWLRDEGRRLTPEEMLRLDQDYVEETLHHLESLMEVMEGFTGNETWTAAAREFWEELTRQWDAVADSERERLLEERGLDELRPLVESGAVVVRSVPLVSRWGRSLNRYWLARPGETGAVELPDAAAPVVDVDASTGDTSLDELVSRFNRRYLRGCLEAAQGALFTFAAGTARLLREMHKELGEVSLLDVLRSFRCQVVLDEVDLRLRNLPNPDVGKTVFAGLSGLGDVEGSTVGRQALARLEVLHREETRVSRHLLLLGGNAEMLNSPLEVFNWGKALGVLPPHLESGTDFLFHHVVVGFELERQMNSYRYLPRIRAFRNADGWREWASRWMEGVGREASVPAAASGQEVTTDASRSMTSSASRSAPDGEGKHSGVAPGAVVVTCPLLEIEREWMRHLDENVRLTSQRQVWMQRISMGTVGALPSDSLKVLGVNGALSDADQTALIGASKLRWVAEMVAEIGRQSPGGWQLVLVDAFAAGLQADHPFTGGLLAHMETAGVRRDEVLLVNAPLTTTDVTRLLEGDYRVVVASHRFSLGASQVWRPLVAVHIPWVGYTPQSLYRGWGLLSASRERYPGVPGWLVTYVKAGVDEYLNKHLFRKVEIAAALRAAGALGDETLRALEPLLSELAYRGSQSEQVRELREIRQQLREAGQDDPAAVEALVQRRLKLYRQLLEETPLERPVTESAQVSVERQGTYHLLTGNSPVEVCRELIPEAVSLTGAAGTPASSTSRVLGQYWIPASLETVARGALPPALGGHCLYYGVAYAPVSPSNEVFSPAVRRLAAAFRVLENKASSVPSASRRIRHGMELVLEAWDMVFPVTSPERFDDLPVVAVSGGAPSPDRSLLKYLLEHFEGSGYEPEAVRPWLKWMQSDLAEMERLPVVDGHVFHPFVPTSLTSYAIGPVDEMGWYVPVLFVTREFRRAESPFETAGEMSVLVYPDMVRIPPHLVVSIGQPVSGRVLLEQRSRLEAELAAPWAELLCPDEKAIAERLVRGVTAPLTARLWQVPQLEQVVGELLERRDRMSDGGARRTADGVVVPPPRWVTERVVGRWAATGDPEAAAAAGIIWSSSGSEGERVAELQPVRCVDRRTGIVAVAEDYELLLGETSGGGGRLTVEPWVRETPPGPLRTLALAIDLAVWEGEPGGIRRLLGAFPPDELRRALPERVWQRWAVTAAWVHAAGGETRVPPGTWWTVYPSGRTADMHLLLRAHLEEVDSRDILRVHSHQMALLAVHAQQMGHPTAAATFRRWALEGGGHDRSLAGAAARTEAAGLLAEYVKTHGPVSARTVVVEGPGSCGGLSFDIWTPSLLNRMERLVVGTPLEETWREVLRELGYHWVEVIEGTHAKLQRIFPESDTATACHALDVALWGVWEARWQDFEVRSAPHHLRWPYWYESGFQTFVAQMKMKFEREEDAPLGVEMRRLKRYRSVNYVSVLNTGLMVLGGLETLEVAARARQRWSDEALAIGDALRGGEAPDALYERLSRLMVGLPVVPLREKVWPELARQWLTEPFRVLELPGWMERVLDGASREHGGTAADLPVLSSKIGALLPVEWLGWGRPAAWRMEGYAGGFSGTTGTDVYGRSAVSPLTPYRHYETLSRS